MTLAQVMAHVRELPRESQFERVWQVVALLQRDEQPHPRRNMLDFAGVGACYANDEDPLVWLNRERDAWDSDHRRLPLLWLE
jgi:hypothetical protein